MARVLAQHGIEQFIYAWLARFRNTSDTRKYKKYMEKAVKQLEFFLNPPCCVDPEATIEFRRLDNDLTRFIAAQLALSLDRRKWKKSLERAILAINNIIDDHCCLVGPFTVSITLDDEPLGESFPDCPECSVSNQGELLFDYPAWSSQDYTSFVIEPGSGLFAARIFLAADEDSPPPAFAGRYTLSVVGIDPSEIEIYNTEWDGGWYAYVRSNEPLTGNIELNFESV
jgi:hypothetical protein